MTMVLLTMAALEAAGHPGRTAADGCHFCRTNCDRWNVEADERHCHGGGSSPTPTTTGTQTQPEPTACPASTGTWRGIRVAPECRCTPYDRDDYRYSQSIEARIAERFGGMFSPYDNTRFGSLRESDIEHMVAVSEAHDSGLCAASTDVRRRFASDLDNLALANPELNRYEKRDHDAAEWLPEYNRCWFAATVVAVRKEYGLTIDRREAAALERILAACDSFELVTPAPS
ncbi:MAG: hypothetical protein OXC31_01655 [Spirochaetaceae bacterium]|nr:hypothetical protein [Spirochaetaceae bacterium]